MTVREVIQELQRFPHDCNVYVPDIRDGTAQIAKQVSGLVHLHVMDTAMGVSIPDDVTITPWEGDLEAEAEQIGD